MLASTLSMIQSQFIVQDRRLKTIRAVVERAITAVGAVQSAVTKPYISCNRGRKSYVIHFTLKSYFLVRFCCQEE